MIIVGNVQQYASNVQKPAKRSLNLCINSKLLSMTDILSNFILSEYMIQKERILVMKFKRRSEEHTSELQSRGHLVCRLLLEKKKQRTIEQHRKRMNSMHV